MIKRTLLATLLILALPLTAEAKQWTVDYTNSKLSFTGQQGEKPFTGGFKKFSLSTDFDPEKPQHSTILATIDITSITAGNSERDSYLPKAEWFDSKSFPQANFTARNIQKTDDGYIADGILTIKDVTNPLRFTFTMKPEEDHFRIKGSTQILRNDFKLGTGDWANENYVKYAVTVNIDLSVKPTP